MEKEDNILDIVKQKFADYLSENNCRKTPERVAILELIYTEHRHFDMDSLHKALVERNFKISKATLYNTMQLLIKCKLVLQHQFGKNLSFYERAYNNENHHHAICTNCGKVIEYKDLELKNMISSKKIKRFTLSHYSLYLYGICSTCTRKLSSKKNIK